MATSHVRELRHQQTKAEKAAWHLLRDQRACLKFRRQYPIESYVIDSYRSELRLAVELDGVIHSQPSQMKKDAVKDAYLGNVGVHVLRVPNGLVAEDPEGFGRTVREAAETIPGKR